MYNREYTVQPILRTLKRIRQFRKIHLIDNSLRYIFHPYVNF